MTNKTFVVCRRGIGYQLSIAFAIVGSCLSAAALYLLFVPGKSLLADFPAPLRAILGFSGFAVIDLFVKRKLLAERNSDSQRALFSFLFAICPLLLIAVGRSAFLSMLYWGIAGKAITAISLLPAALFVCLRSAWLRGQPKITEWMIWLVGPLVAHGCLEFMIWASQFSVMEEGGATMRWTAFYANAVMGLGVVSLFIFTTGQLRLSGLLSIHLFAFLFFANVFKIRALHSPVAPQDIRLIRELLIVGRSSLGLEECCVCFGIVCSVLACCIAGFWREGRRRWLERVMPLFVVFVAILPVRTEFARVSSAPWVPLWAWSERGTLLHIAVKSLLWSRPIPSPSGFDRRRVSDDLSGRNKMISSRHSGFDSSVGGSPNIVFLLLESFVDPIEIGLPLREDPIPFVRNLRSSGGIAWSITPGILGGSSTSEFELLTGFESRILGEGVIPYHSMADRSHQIDSVPFLLNSIGFQSIVLMVDPKAAFNRVAAYERLKVPVAEWVERSKGGVFSREDVIGISDLEEAERDTIMFGRLIERLEKAEKPVYGFAFSGSTHHPYSSSVARFCNDSDGNFVQQEIEGYCAELNFVDSLLSSFWSRLLELDRRTILVIVGDHLPPLRCSVGPYRPTGDGDRFAIRKVPLMILDTSGTIVRTPSVVFHWMLPSIALRAAGLEPISPFDQMVRDRISESEYNRFNIESTVDDAPEWRDYRNAVFFELTE